MLTKNPNTIIVLVMYFYINDHLGSTRAMIDTAGTLLDRHMYNAFGATHQEITVTNQPRKYTGQEFEDENNLNIYYYGARYYDPEVGRFLAVDPLHGKYPEWGPYVYTLNNPLKYVDPDGRDTRRNEEVRQRSEARDPDSPVDLYVPDTEEGIQEFLTDAGEALDNIAYSAADATSVFGHGVADKLSTTSLCASAIPAVAKALDAAATPFEVLGIAADLAKNEIRPDEKVVAQAMVDLAMVVVGLLVSRSIEELPVGEAEKQLVETTVRPIMYGANEAAKEDEEQ